MSEPTTAGPDLRRAPTGTTAAAAALTSAQARSLVGSTVEIWSNDDAEASEGVAPDWLGTVADVVSVGDKWHFVIQED